MAVKKLNGRTIDTEEGFFPKEVVDSLHKRLAEEGAKAKKPAKKSTKKPTKKSE